MVAEYYRSSLTIHVNVCSYKVTGAQHKVGFTHYRNYKVSYITYRDCGQILAGDLHKELLLL